MKKYILLKDLPNVQRGEIFEESDNGRLVIHKNLRDRIDAQFDIEETEMNKWFFEYDEESLPDLLYKVSVDDLNRFVINIYPETYEMTFNYDVKARHVGNMLMSAWELYKNIKENYAGSFEFDGYEVSFKQKMTDEEKVEKMKAIEDLQRDYETKNPQFVSEIMNKDDVLKEVDEGGSMEQLNTTNDADRGNESQTLNNI